MKVILSYSFCVNFNSDGYFIVVRDVVSWEIFDFVDNYWEFNNG